MVLGSSDPDTKGDSLEAGDGNDVAEVSVRGAGLVVLGSNVGLSSGLVKRGSVEV